MLIYLAGAILASVPDVTPQDKLIFRLLKRNQAIIGADIIRDLLARYADVRSLAEKDPLEILDFIKDIVDRWITKSDLVAAEYADWTREASFSDFRFSSQRMTAQSSVG